VALLIAWSQFAPPPAVGVASQKLTIREDADRVVIAWSGPVEKPMRDEIAAAIDRFKADPRRLVVSLNSPGGAIAQGREVMAAIGDAAHRREIDTLVDKGAVCASMCVPIYLLGAEREADPSALFMFHEVSLEAPDGPNKNRLEAVLKLVDPKMLETMVTDSFYRDDLGGPRVNAQWVAAMRRKIAGREVWVSAQQLVDEGSGVVDAFVRTAPD
jgi:ATP-dependent protease ClpP protease subunit